MPYVFVVNVILIYKSVVHAFEIKTFNFITTIYNYESFLNGTVRLVTFGMGNSTAFGNFLIDSYSDTFQIIKRFSLPKPHAKINSK